MKRNTKTVMAFVLTLLLIATFPVAVFADTPTSGTISGSSTVDTVVVNVILPTSLNFALDPLGLDTTGDNQIATQDFFFVNQTFAPVKISIDIDAETSGGAVLVSTTGGLSLDDTSVTDKDLYFGALGATGLTGASITATTVGVSYSAIFGSPTGPAASYSTVSAVAETLTTIDPSNDGTTGSAVISFALDKAVESSTTPGSIDSLAASDKGVAAFQFYSQLNTYAEWEADDITVTGSYTLIPLRDTTYTGYDYIAGSLNQLVPEEEEVVTPSYDSAGFIIGDDTFTTHAAITVSKASADDVSIAFFYDGLTITSLVMNGTYTVLDADYDAVGNALVFNKDGAGTYLLDKSSVAVKTFVLTLSDSSTYTFSINLTL